MTNPSHLSIMTGLPTREHGVSSNFVAMPEGLDTLATALGREGYHTAAFISARPLAAAFGWTGFDTLPDVVGELDAREVTDRAVSWLAEAGHEPLDNKSCVACRHGMAKPQIGNGGCVHVAFQSCAAAARHFGSTGAQGSAR